MADDSPQKVPSKRPTTRAGRQARQVAALQTTFQPRFIETADQRLRAIKLIRQRLERLKEEAGCDSFQKEMLAEQAIFIAVQLETMKVTALEGGEFSPGSYTQMVNCLAGLLGKIGLQRQAAKVLDLNAYLTRVKQT